MPKPGKADAVETELESFEVSVCFVPKPGKAGVESLKVSVCFVPKTERAGV